MPEHIHLLLEGTIRISKALNNIKRPFARAILAEFAACHDERLPRYLHRDSQNRIVRRIWQAGGGYDRNLFTDKAIRTVTHYIHENPDRSDLVDAPEQ